MKLQAFEGLPINKRLFLPAEKQSFIMRNTVMNIYQKTFIASALLLMLANWLPVQKTNAQQLVTENHECFLKNYTLAMNLVAQTDTYVTYEVDWIFFGEGNEVAKEWVTFVLADGHRLKEIISNKNMMRFYKKHPELRNEDIWKHFHAYDRSYLVDQVGLLNDSVAHQYPFAPGIYEEANYPLDVIAPYLSKEAKELIDKR